MTAQKRAERERLAYRLRKAAERVDPETGSLHELLNDSAEALLAEIEDGKRLREALRDDVMLALAERLIADLDAIEQKRHMAVYERDARLVARAYLALTEHTDERKAGEA